MATGFFKAAYLTWFSKPADDRALYRTVKRHRPERILLVGLGDGQRALQLIGLAQRCAGRVQIEVTGVDLFEGRSSDAASRLTLKDAHRKLRDTGAHVKLVPGDPYSALSRTANSLPNVDLMLVDCDQDADSVAQAWFYAPRMLHDASVVLVERSRGVDKKSDQQLRQFDRLDHPTIEQMASLVRVRRAA